MTAVPDMPRTLLLTWWAPELPYAGGEVLRKTLRCLPGDRIRWTSLAGSSSLSGDSSLPEWRLFPVPRLHWRLRGTAVERWFVDRIWAPIRARRIARWVRDFAPEMLWTVPELDSVAVALHLRRLLDVPLHLTVHDAFEGVRHTNMSRACLSRFLANVRRLSGGCDSLDAVSQPLVDHLCRDSRPSRVYAPSMPRAWMQKRPVGPDTGTDGRLRKIGLCGSLRVSATQWQGFVDALGVQPFRFQLRIVSDPDRYPDIRCPANVELQFQPYFSTESELVDFLQGAGLFASYLGLWREEERALFSRTSLSSKLSAYAAAGIPVLVDGPRDSAAWELLQQYEAGLLLDDAGGQQMEAWLDDVDGWPAMSAGAQKLAEAHFDLEGNVGELVQLWRSVVDGHRSSGSQFTGSHCSDRDAHAGPRNYPRT